MLIGVAVLFGAVIAVAAAISRNSEPELPDLFDTEGWSQL